MISASLRLQGRDAGTGGAAHKVMATVTRPLAGCRIGLFGRGGSGKSTCTVLLVRGLEEHRGGFAPAGAESRVP